MKANNKRDTNKQKSKGISRVDSETTHGWFVRGYKNGKTYSKLFSDKKFGSEKKALNEAKKYKKRLDEELTKIPKKPKGRRIVFADARNATGVLGVSRTQKYTNSGTAHECYSVSWHPEPGVQKCTSFSINKYGEKEALKLAINLRKKKMQEIYGVDYLEKLQKLQYKIEDTIDHDIT